MSKEVGEMVRSRDVVQAEGSARTEGARRATGVRADGAAAGAGSLAPGQRWSASRKRDVVLRLLRGESLEALSREAGVEIYRLDAWRERAMAGLENAPVGRDRGTGALTPRRQAFAAPGAAQRRAWGSTKSCDSGEFCTTKHHRYVQVISKYLRADDDDVPRRKSSAESWPS